MLSSECVFLRTIQSDLLLSNYKNLYERLQEYSARTEKNFLSRREILEDAITFCRPKQNNFNLREQKETEKEELFKVETVNKKEVLLTLPKLYSKQKLYKKDTGKEKFSSSGASKYIKNNIQNAIKKAQEQGKTIPFFTTAVIVFEHILESKNKNYDADNMDVKGAIDALKGVCFGDDNLNQVSVFHTARVSDTGNAETKMYIIEDSAFPEWIARFYAEKGAAVQ